MATSASLANLTKDEVMWGTLAPRYSYGFRPVQVGCQFNCAQNRISKSWPNSLLWPATHSNTSWRLTPSDYVFLFCAKMYQGSLMLRLWEPFSTAIFAEEKGGQEQTKGLNVGKFWSISYDLKYSPWKNAKENHVYMWSIYIYTYIYIYIYQIVCLQQH